MKDPACAAVECAACKDGHCVALVNNDFGKRKCPFFKTKEQAAKEQAYCEQRMAKFRIGNREGRKC